MKVLVGYDGTEIAKNALKLAVEMAKTVKAEVHLINSILTGQSKAETFEFIDNVPASQVEDLKKAEKILAEAGKELEKVGLSHETHLANRQLSPGEDIVMLAKELSVDYIVVGIQRKSKLGKVLFGSTAQYVVLNAHCPVVTTK